MRVNIVIPDLGTVRAEYVDDWDTGTTTYTVTGPRVAGAFQLTLDLIRPDDSLDVDTPHICVTYGRSNPGSYHEMDRDDLPVINGVRLVGATVVDADVMRQRRLAARHVNVRRALDRYSAMQAPDKTKQRTAAVVGGLLTHWLTRPDNLALRLAALRHSAARLRGSLAHSITGQRERVAAAAAELERLEGLDAAAQAMAEMPPAR